MDHISNPATKHQYEVEYKALASTGEVARGKVLVDANTRTQAGAIVRRSGYTVCSVNMVA